MGDLASKIEVINDKVVFQFLEDMQDSKFRTVTKTGIVVAEQSENQVGKARWGKVLLVGPDVSEFGVDDYILIEPLRWTTALELDNHDEQFWMTDEKSVFAVTDEYPE